MTTCFLAPDPIQGTWFIPGSNTPANGGLLFFYSNLSTTKQLVYKDPTGSVAHTDPIVLDSGGNIPAGAEVWFVGGQTYTVVYAPANDTDPPASPYRTLNNLTGVNDTAVSTSEWVSGPTPTFVNSTQFTLVGDQTATFTIGRRLKTTITAGTGYHTITNAVFGALTTVTVNGTALDAGLSAVSYSFLSSANSAIPGASLVLGAYTFDRGVSISSTTDATKILNFDINAGPSSTTRKIYSGLPERLITNTSGAFLESDYNKFVNINTTAILGLPHASTMIGWTCDFQNTGPGTVTVTSTANIFVPGCAQAGSTSATFPYSGTGIGNYNMSGGKLFSNGTSFRLINPLESHGIITVTTVGGFTTPTPAGVTTGWIDSCAGAGGGGASAGGANAGTGGGGAESLASYQISLVPGVSITGTTGAGGAAGISGGASGLTGSSTVLVFPSTTLTLTPGVGGANDSAVGGTGGSGLVGAIPGSAGGSGTAGGGALATAQGGSSAWGVGGATAMAIALQGFGYGAGGSGRAATAGNGAAGTPGFFRLRY